MIRIFLLFLLASLSFSKNSYPIILIHGFLGWGKDEMAGYYYWGGRVDYEQKLINSGFEVYTVSIGPISNNRDRAIETFYQIKGGQVDYGNEKAQILDIIQKPINKRYDGLYPAWDNNHPVHIIAHSQGGQTARMLEILLKEKFIGEDSHLLSKSLHGWIKSITTISTPHNGSTLVPIMLDVFPFSLRLAPWFGSIDSKTIDNFYSFDLEQWGLKKEPDESFDEFSSRLSKSPLSDSKNLCTWELSPEGAKEFNKMYKTDNHVYYFAFTTSTTNQKNGSQHHIPNTTMAVHLWPTAMLIGSYDQDYDSTWYENDGIVNSISMSHPFGFSTVNFSGDPQPGVWQSMQMLNFDHQLVIGHGANSSDHKNIFVLYKNHCDLLLSLK